MERDSKRLKLNSNDETAIQSDIKVVIGDLQQRLTEISSFDPAEMINFQYDDLIIEVRLVVRSQIEHLNKVEAEHLKQIEQHRAEWLGELSSGERLDEMKQEIFRWEHRFSCTESREMF